MSATGRVHKAAMDDIEKGRFVRKESVFRDFVKADGSTRFKPEAGRYRLYISLACPWASRAFMTIKLKGLEDIIPITVVHYHMGKEYVLFVDIFSLPPC
jgi:glutathionyl-hydroquinone reductase